jgi:group II intron reverse transcriptase/maturase
LVLEPVFEADFEEDSYGFRKKRDAHQALDAIEEALQGGMWWVLDADITAYFDTIPHDRLMKTVAERVVDGSMLRLIKAFLEAPIIDDRDGGGPRRNRLGTPQGGVISPLLANIYLHLVDRNFRRQVERGALNGRLIRYADDLVVLAPRPPTRERQWLETVLKRLGLTLHPTKTRIANAEEEQFDFLGHTLHWKYSRKNAGHKLYFDISRKRLQRIRDELKSRTKNTVLSIEQVVDSLNAYIPGARQYFRRVVARRTNTLDHFVYGRVARWWRRKHKLARPAWWLARDRALWTKYGLERWYHPRSRSEAAR